MIASYYRSSDSTKVTYRNILERFRSEHGDKRVAMIQRKHIQKMVSDWAATPTAANRLVRMIHLRMRPAVEMGWRRDDPNVGVRKVKVKSGGFTTWEDTHVDLFLDQHKPGTRAHLAMMLLLYTGQRRSDVVRMGRQQMRNNVLSVAQQKTGQHVETPLFPELKTTLDSLPKDNMTFLVGERGSPLTSESFTNWFRRVVREVTYDVKGKPEPALPDGLSPHGLRKATCRKIAGSGCTPHQIMAISGHKTLSEVTGYTEAASRKGLAQEAMASLDQAKGGT